jgi:hypothetical protein
MSENEDKIIKIIELQQTAIELMQGYINELHSHSAVAWESLNAAMGLLTDENASLRKRNEELERKYSK